MHATPVTLRHAQGPLPLTGIIIDIRTTAAGEFLYLRPQSGAIQPIRLDQIESLHPCEPTIPTRESHQHE